MDTTLITQDLLEYANSLPAGFYSISTASDTPNAIGVSATGYILRRTGVDAIVALYGITSGTLNVNHYDGHTWLGWLKYTTNTDLTARFNPIEINGTKGDTFKNVLKNKCNNSVNFIVFNGSTENPISDNPFTSKNGYCIAFNSDRLNAYNYFILLGITKDIIETKIFDARS